ncbi:hypothetical protein HPP92_003354 [Vanilla planifolia]|uniref:50S ribosomal protein L18, chloroplastic n=1 Tax=Vanilla planifolia TaxID=51239 RepID=A0A835S7A1_VANPL|nr:hypothetical protein HPP92_003354 [Vanilla planifolia]
MKCSLAELHNLLPGYLAQTILRAIVLHRDRCSSKRRQFDNFQFNGSSKRPRLSVFCSAKQLYAMLVDDHNKKTLFYASTLQNSIREDPQCSTIEAAQKVGQAIVQACMELDISEISSYDRNGFARGERMQAFEVAIAEHGFLPR